jgi:hypothetical protein
MAIWQKIDDSTTVADQPYSAFLAKRLTTNVNAYSTDLSRNTAAAWPFETPVRWASYGQPTGTIVMVDCGLNALELQFRLSCFTDTATGGGTIYIKHIESGARTSRFFAATTYDKTVFDIEFVFTSPVRGLQSFFVGWISDDDETLGTVAIKGGVANQVYIGNGGSWTFPVGAGQSAEMHARLHFNNTPNVGELAPIGDARLDYQVCLFSHRSGNNPHGVFTIWPELEQTPAFLPTFYSSGMQMIGTLIGLGVLNLRAVAATVTRQTAGTLAAPTAFSQTTPPTALANNIGAALTTCRPMLANHVSTPGMLGLVLPAEETLSFAFAVQNEGEYGLFVVFKTFGYNISQTANCVFTLTVFEAFTDTKVLGPIDLENLAVPRLQPQTTQSATAAAAFAVNGIVASEGKWGLRDSMPMSQPTVGTTVRFLTDAITLGDIAGQGAAYYATITATTDVYIYSFSARLI